MKTTVESLQLELEQIRSRQKRRREANEKDSQRWHHIQDELLRLKTAELLNKPNGVQVAIRRCQGHKCYPLNDLYGTLTNIRRTRCTVVFSNGQSWNMMLESIRPADNLQGCELNFSGGVTEMFRPEETTVPESAMS
ncbi:MAG: hypothetical protein WCJ35_21720 [Planctomycetota bacterium]